MKLKKTFSVVTASVLSLSMAFAFTACGGNTDEDDGKDKENAVISAITLNETAELENHSSVSVLKEVKYSDGTTKKINDSNIEWKSSNESVATVNKGIVSGLTAGETQITAKYNSVTSNVCTVTVIPGRVVTILDSEGEPLTALTLDVGKDDEKSAQLTAKVTREGSDTEVEDQEIVWSTADDQTVSVNASGLVTAIKDTEEDSPVTVTATIKDTSIKADLPVTVTWTGKDDLTFDASTYEQNKSPAGIWNYWGDKNYNWGDTTIAAGATYVDPTYEENHTADTANGFKYIGANKVTTHFTIDSWKDSEKKNEAAIQLFYRSAGDEGELETNHNYEVKLKIKSSAAGTVSLNDYTKLPGGGETPDDPRTEIGEITEDEEYKFEINANEETTITVKFRHGDSGAVYKSGVYNNIESAIQLCLGKLGEVKELVTVEVYDIQYKDLGEAEKKFYDNATLLDGYVAPPPEGVLGETHEAVYTANNNDGDTLTAENTWAVWYVQSAEWDCGAEVTMDITLDNEAKSCTLVYNPNGNTNNWGVQLRYIPADVEEGQMFKVNLKINSTVAYSITLNGSTYNLEVGDNDIEFYWTKGSGVAGAWMLNGQINNVGGTEEITLVISELTWTDFTPAQSGGEEGNE